MARRRESVFDLLVLLPWYVAAAVGAVTWLTAPFLPRLFGGGSQVITQMQPVASELLRLFAYLCFGAAAISALRSLFLARKFNAQQSLADLRELSWQQFESIVGEAFRRRGYFVLETGQGGADGGVDLVLSKDGQRFLVQCKRYREATVGVTVIREIFGVVAARNAAGAIVVTTGRFTSECEDFARGLPIELIDGAKLEAMVRNINRLSPVMTDSAPDVRTCPRCRGPMVLRTARRTHEQFYGCSRFPKCRGTRPV